MKRVLTSLAVSVAFTATVFAQGSPLIRRGEVLHWSTSSGQNGLMKIMSVDGMNFEVEQTNEMNRAAGAVRLFGAIVENGRKVVLINPGQWKEVWDGNAFGEEISGKLLTGSASFTFKINRMAAPVAAGTFPFVTGKVLRWETGGIGEGTLVVTFAKGSNFTVEQSNLKNRAAGIIKMEGEVHDGKFVIFNRKFNETWTGFYRNGVVSGMINDRSPFKIFE